MIKPFENKIYHKLIFKDKSGTRGKASDKIMLKPSEHNSNPTRNFHLLRGCSECLQINKFLSGTERYFFVQLFLKFQDGFQRVLA